MNLETLIALKKQAENTIKLIDDEIARCEDFRHDVWPRRSVSMSPAHAAPYDLEGSIPWFSQSSKESVELQSTFSESGGAWEKVPVTWPSMTAYDARTHVLSQDLIDSDNYRIRRVCGQKLQFARMSPSNYFTWQECES